MNTVYFLSEVHGILSTYELSESDSMDNRFHHVDLILWKYAILLKLWQLEGWSDVEISF